MAEEELEEEQAETTEEEEEEQPCPLQAIDTAIMSLNQIKLFLDTAFIVCEGMAQEYVDEYIEKEINPYVNAKLAEWRQGLLECLQETYQELTKAEDPASEISTFDISADISKIVDFLKLVKDFITKAYASMMEILTLFASHLTRLTSAIDSVKSYRPPISGISFDKLDIQCEPITMGDITGES